MHTEISLNKTFYSAPIYHKQWNLYTLYTCMIYSNHTSSTVQCFIVRYSHLYSVSTE